MTEVMLIKKKEKKLLLGSLLKTSDFLSGLNSDEAFVFGSNLIKAQRPPWSLSKPLRVKQQASGKELLTFFSTLSSVSGRLMSKQIRTASESG